MIIGIDDNSLGGLHLMFSKALDVILPKKEADPYIPDFKYLSEKRQLIRTYYGGVKYSLGEDGRKVQQLIDHHIRSRYCRAYESQRTLLSLLSKYVKTIYF
jgi:hypothetical protein